MVKVRVISRKALRTFAERHPEAGAPLGAWFKLASHCAARNLAELKQTFASVDLVRIGSRDFFVFNIEGNKYRLVAAIHFDAQRLFVRRLMTHPEYSKELWKKAI